MGELNFHILVYQIHAYILLYEYSDSVNAEFLHFYPCFPIKRII